MKGWVFVALLLTGSLVALTGLRQFFIEPLANPATNGVWFLIQLLPLMLPLPGLLHARLRSTFIMCMVSTLYFIHGVLITFDPDMRLLGVCEIVFSLGLCGVTAYMVRHIRELEAS